MNAAVSVDHVILLAGLLFALGLLGVLVRRNFVYILISLEVMLNACGLAFIAAGARWADADGQIMFILVLTLAAAEVSVGLALLMQLYRRFGTVDADAFSRMRG